MNRPALGARLMTVAAARGRRLVVIAALLVPTLAAPVHAVTLFGLVNTGELYASPDGGVTWAIQSTLPVRDAAALIAGTSSTELFLASESGSIYRSTNSGASWTVVGAVPASDISAMAGQPGRILLLTRSGSVYASLDYGDNFIAVGTITASDVVSVTRQSAAHFALTQSGSIYRSADNGVTWSAVGALAVSNAVDVASFGAALHVLTATGDLARSNDDGVSWSFISTLSQSGMTAMLASPVELIASSAAGEAAATANGTSWTWRGAIGQLTVRALANDMPTLVSVDSRPRTVLQLAAPSPNPAREQTLLALDLDRAAEVTVEIVDIAGRVVATPIARERLPVGRTARAWRPDGLASGLYYVRARTHGWQASRPMVWLGGG